MYTIFEPDYFEPSAKIVLDQNTSLGRRGYITCKQNATKIEIKNGVYKPRLTLTNRISFGQYDTSLKIELSLPKLLFGNNFDELQENY